MIRRLRSAGTSAGSITIEVAILLPAFMLLVLLAASFGREAVAQTSVDLAAHDAARAASITRIEADAQKVAYNAAAPALATTCTSFTVKQLDAPLNPQFQDGFTVPAGVPATVTFQVTCQVSLADLAFPFMPGSVTVTSLFTSPIDTYRFRSTT